MYYSQFYYQLLIFIFLSQVGTTIEHHQWLIISEFIALHICNTRKKLTLIEVSGTQTILRYHHFL